MSDDGAGNSHKIRILWVILFAHDRIMNPLAGGGIANLFSTHPATEERIARLMEMARTGRFD